MSGSVAITTLVALAGWGVAAAALRELLRARRRLEAVARAEHELRGPATVLLLACERMRRDRSARRHVWALEVELERMRRALGALTAARRGRAAAEHPSAEGEERRDLKGFVGGALAGWEPSLRAAGRPLRFRWDAGRVGLPAQRSALASALANLVSNAAEHGTGPVDVRGSRSPDAVRVEIRNGSRRAGSGAGRQGRGLGLGIAGDAAREAGGSLAVTHAPDEFTAALELPLGEAGGSESGRAEAREPRRAGGGRSPGGGRLPSSGRPGRPS